MIELCKCSGIKAIKDGLAPKSHINLLINQVDQFGIMYHLLKDQREKNK